jgi:hypothetical protein
MAGVEAARAVTATAFRKRRRLTESAELMRRLLIKTNHRRSYRIRRLGLNG